MSAGELFIVGVGGQGREAESIVAALNARTPTWRLGGFVDDAPSALNRDLVAALGHTVIGSVADLLARPPAAYILGIGNGIVRARLDRLLTAAGWQAPAIVHPDTSIGTHVVLGPGALISAGVRMSTNIVLSRQVAIGANATIGHDVSLGECSTVLPGAVVSGGVAVDPEATIGASATVLPYLRIGAGARVGAGAVVVREVPAAVTVKGVPAC